MKPAMAHQRLGWAIAIDALAGAAIVGVVYWLVWAVMMIMAGAPL